MPWEHASGYLFMSLLPLLMDIPRSGLAGSCGDSVFDFFELPKCFPQQLHHFTFPPAGHENDHFPPTSLRNQPGVTFKVVSGLF